MQADVCDRKRACLYWFPKLGIFIKADKKLPKSNNNFAAKINQ
jgi:hypothetical protein